jgi:hypothetical protein
MFWSDPRGKAASDLKKVALIGATSPGNARIAGHCEKSSTPIFRASGVLLFLLVRSFTSLKLSKLQGKQHSR